MTNPSDSTESQPPAEVQTQADSPPRQVPDRTWVEFDVGLRNQDPNTIQHKVVGPSD
jgi:hypothetical protein